MGRSKDWSRSIYYHIICSGSDVMLSYTTTWLQPASELRSCLALGTFSNRFGCCTSEKAQGEKQQLPH